MPTCAATESVSGRRNPLGGVDGLPIGRTQHAATAVRKPRARNSLDARSRLPRFFSAPVSLELARGVSKVLPHDQRTCISSVT